MAESFGEYMRRKRLELDLTLERVAEGMGLNNHSTVQRYESGIRSVAFDVAMTWAKAVKLSKVEVSAAWVKANGGETASVNDIPAEVLEYVRDPDVQEMVFYYGGTPTDMRPSVKGMAKRVKTAADYAREEEEKYTIGKRADRPEPEEDDPDTLVFKADD